MSNIERLFQSDSLVKEERPEEPKIYQHKKEIKAIQSINGNEFMKKQFPPTNWIVEDMLPEGLGLLAGDPKVGKSFLALSIVLNVINGENVFNRLPTKKCKALLMNYEDINRRLYERINRLRQEGIGNIGNLLIGENLGTLTENGIEQLRKTLQQDPEIKLVVIDTYQRAFSDKKISNANPYAEQYNLLAPYQSLAEEMHVCILFIHHTRKQSADNPFDRMSGTNGLAGATDFNMLLESKGIRFSDSKEADLFITGKDIEEKKLHLIFEPETCIWEENENYTNEPDTTPERKQIIGLFGNNPNKVLKTSEISIQLGGKNISRQLTKLVNEGFLDTKIYGEYTLKTNL